MGTKTYDHQRICLRIWFSLQNDWARWHVALEDCLASSIASGLTTRSFNSKCTRSGDRERIKVSKSLAFITPAPYNTIISVLNGFTPKCAPNSTHGPSFEWFPKSHTKRTTISNPWVRLNSFQSITPKAHQWPAMCQTLSSFQKQERGQRCGAMCFRVNKASSSSVHPMGQSWLFVSHVAESYI